MAKTNPIGVRFDKELLDTIINADLAPSPQKALILYEKSYLELVQMKVENNNKPENKARIEAERNTPPEPIRQPGEDALAFAMRKSEWKKNNPNQ